MSPRADTWRALAAAAETTGSVRAALIAWAQVVPDPVVARVGRRAKLGVPLGEVTAPLRSLPDGPVVERAVTAHARHGGSLARTMRALADAYEGRARLAHDARMASSASTLSTRLLAGLGLMCVLLAPTWQRSSLAVTAASLGAALVLAGAGTAWMRRLVPRPPVADPPAAAIADLAAALLDGGLYPAAALDLACPEGLPARRLVRLGMSWTAALSRTADAELEGLAEILRTTDGSGSAARWLRLFARSLREEQRSACESLTRRAPVLLVLPLTLCFLPAFGLVMLIPLLGGLSG